MEVRISRLFPLHLLLLEDPAYSQTLTLLHLLMPILISLRSYKINRIEQHAVKFQFGKIRICFICAIHHKYHCLCIWEQVKNKHGHFRSTCSKLVEDSPDRLSPKLGIWRSCSGLLLRCFQLLDVQQSLVPKLFLMMINIEIGLQFVKDGRFSCILQANDDQLELLISWK